MQATKVPVKNTDLYFIVQGFKGSVSEYTPPGADEVETLTVEPSVLVGVWSTAQDEPLFEGGITIENANIVAEEIRKHAEWANQPQAEQGE